jgi:hypothetical protein
LLPKLQSAERSGLRLGQRFQPIEPNLSHCSSGCSRWGLRGDGAWERKTEKDGCNEASAQHTEHA